MTKKIKEIHGERPESLTDEDYQAILDAQNWSKFDVQWMHDAMVRGVDGPYTQKLLDEMDARLLKQIETHSNLKDLAAKYLPEDPSKVEWIAPEPKPLGEMSEADRALVKSIYWSYFHGAAQQWKDRDGSQEH